MQLTPESFGAGESLPDGPVLVVGDGASGRDLAVLASATHPVMLATGKPRKLVPECERGLASLARRGVEPRPGLTGPDGDTALFADGARRKAASVVWAVGYRDQTDWIEITGAVDENRRFRHSEGASPVPGLSYVGRPWQRNRASALIMGVGEDARRIVEAIKREDLHARRPQPRGSMAAESS